MPPWESCSLPGIQSARVTKIQTNSKPTSSTSWGFHTQPQQDQIEPPSHHGSRRSRCCAKGLALHHLGEDTADARDVTGGHQQFDGCFVVRKLIHHLTWRWRHSSGRGPNLGSNLGSKRKKPKFSQPLSFRYRSPGTHKEWRLQQRPRHQDAQPGHGMKNCRSTVKRSPKPSLPAITLKAPGN